MTAPLKLYELAGADPEVRFSPHCWKTRMALAHKGLDPAAVPWRFTEKEAIAFSGQGLVPVLVDGDQTVADSWRIAEYLEARYPERPSLFDGAAGHSLCRFVNSFADSLSPLLARILVLDIHARLHPDDLDYFRSSREKRFGMPLEQVAADPDAARTALRAALAPLRVTLQAQPFLAGDAPAYADYAAFGLFMWARIVSPVDLLAPDDSLQDWRERLLDLFDGLARRAPTG